YRLTYTGYPLVLEGYTNASWISNTEDDSSTSGWIFLLGGGVISWASKKQTCITSSTIESEFVALATGGKEAEWLENLLLEIPLWSKPIAHISIRYDSAATLAKAYSQMYNAIDCLHPDLGSTSTNNAEHPTGIESDNAFMSTSKLNDSITWHARLGSVHFKRMQDMSKDGLIPAFDMDIEKWNKKYFMTFIDDASRAVVRLSDPKLKTLSERGIKCIFVGYAEHSKAFSPWTKSEVPEEVTEEVVQQPEPELRKSKRNMTLQDFGPGFQLYLIKGIRDEDVAFWKEAINDEMDSIMSNNTWVLANLPPGCKPLGCKWIFKRKLKVDGIVEKFKARLIAFLNGELEEEVDLTKEFLSSRFLLCKGHGGGGDNVILNFNYFDCTPVSTPIDTSEKLMPNNGQVVSQLEYSRVIGCLKYAMTCIRPDIAFDLDQQTWKILVYNVVGFLLGGGAISWASKKQTCNTGSTMKSEFVALAAAGKEAELLKNLILEILLWSKPIAPNSIHCNSAATLANAYIQMYNGKSRHLGFGSCVLSIQLVMPSYFQKKFRWGIAFATGLKRFTDPVTKLRMKHTNCIVRIPKGLYPCRIEAKLTKKQVGGKWILVREMTMISKDGEISKFPGYTIRLKKKRSQEYHVLRSSLKWTANVNKGMEECKIGGERVDVPTDCSLDVTIRSLMERVLLLVEEFCLSNEMEKLENEFWNHTMVGSNHVAYTNRFHELAKLVPYLVIPESSHIKRYIHGLVPQIRGMLRATQPTTIQSAILTVGILTDEAVCCGTLTKGNDNRKKMDVYRITGQARNPLALEVNKNTRNNGNQARGKAFNGNAVEALQDPKFAPLLNVEPCIVNPGYAIEITDGKNVEVDIIIRDCKLELGYSI
ncbi:hypothetical protein Tco_0441855, partial [Tanacetum coccineum]